MKFTERMQHYVFPVTTIAPGQIQEGVNVQTDLDAPFRLSGISIWTPGGEFDGQLSFRFKRPDGRLTQRLYTTANIIAPGNQYATGLAGANPNRAFMSPVTPNIMYPPESVITMDIQSLAESEPPELLTALIVFSGVKVYRQGDIWAPTYPPKFTARPYLDALTIQNYIPANGPLLNQIYTVQQDADFVWQCGLGTDFAIQTSTSVAVNNLPDLGVIVRDWRNQSYMNSYVPVPLLFPWINALMPGWTYPEIYVPTRQQLIFDLNLLF